MHKIEWTDKTWNVITGCTQISPACDNCYAKAMTKRLQGMARKELEKETNFKCKECGFDFCGHSEIEDFIDDEFYSEIYCAGDCGGLEIHKPFDLPKYYLGWDKVVFHKESLNDILDKKKYPSGSKVFVNSMSDTFHEDISDEDIVELFYSMSQRQDLIFQVLTKRADRMLKFFEWYVPNYVIGEFADYFYEDMHKHIWFGATAENQEYVDKRIPKLLKLKDVVNKDIKCFVSLEPLLSEIDLSAYIECLDWVIVGGENIPNNPNKARLMKLEWVESIWNQCRKKDVPFFFKQWGNNVEESIEREKYPLLPMWIEKHKEFPYQKEWIVEVRGCGSSNFYEKVEFDTQREANAYRANEYVNRRIFHKDTHRLAREHREMLEKCTQKRVSKRFKEK